MPGPLDGYRVVDLTQIVSGPLATMLLADQGADVIKVETLAGGDIARMGGFASNGVSAFFANNNRGKRSVALDLAAQDGRDALLGLCRSADVLVENFRPGAMDRLGLGYGDVRPVNPEIVYVSISGFGDDGPYAARPVLDPVIQGMTGIVSRQVNPEFAFPDLVRQLVADKATALTAAQAITAALLVRERGGGGQRVTVPMLDSALYFFWPDGMMDHTWLGDGATPGTPLASVYNLTRTADGQLVYFVVSYDQFKGLFRALGHPEWCDDERFTVSAMMANPEHYLTLGALLTDAFAQQPTTEVLERMHDEDVPCGPVLSLDEVPLDVQVVHNQALVEWEHPVGGRLRQARPGARFSVTPVEPRYTVPAHGEHTAEVLAELRGHRLAQANTATAPRPFVPSR
jgi:crotonobetainyl-CoA:carnitine CoA-transferase CaiB-like acyl-CoA transferase